MSLDEKLFYYLWKFRNEMKKEKIPNQAVHFSAGEGSLGIFTSLLGKKTIKVKKGKHLGGMVGDTLFFPPHICVSLSQSINYLAYLHHACFAMTARELNFSLKYEAVSPFDRVLATLIAAPMIMGRMRLNYPALFFEARTLYQDYLNSNPKQSDAAKYEVEDKIRHRSHDILEQILEEREFEKNLSPQDMAEQCLAWRKEFRGLKLRGKVEIPPFFSLLPLEGIILFHKEEAMALTESDRSEIQTTIQTDSKDVVKRVEINEDENYNPASILMESVQTLDIFSGGLKRIDGSDELNEHQEGLEDLDINQVVRTNRETKSIFQADMVYEVVSDGSESNRRLNSPLCFSYDEWDASKGRYLSQWCQLYEKIPESNGSSESGSERVQDLISRNSKQILSLRRRLERIIHSRQWKNRQKSGEDIDIDAVVSAISSMRAGKNADDAFYMSKPKRNQDIAVLVLLDASLSADSYIDGKRVLDISKEAIVVIQEALSALFENISIMAFNGQTRQNCEYYCIQEFGSTWPSAKEKLMSVEPAGYTRIGPALRHSLFKISKTKSTHKVIILISDGKPTDYDVYEGKYGVQDVRQVVREAKQKNVQIMSLAVDQSAKFHFPLMFGKNNFRVLKDPAFLADQFMDLFARLI